MVKSSRPGRILGTRLPFVAAPMAGGPTTTKLAAAVADAGGFSFLAGGYKTPEALTSEVAEMRKTDAPFGVNLFAPNVCRISEPEFRRYARELQDEADTYGLDLSRAPLVEDDDHWPDKLEVLLSVPVPVVSVTFGLPKRAEVMALQRAGSQVLVTVTTVDEALAAAEIGPDGLIAQGTEAGGHNGTHDPRRAITPMPAGDLTQAVIAATGLPVIAAGGVDGPQAVADLVRAGAEGVAVGTLLLRADESGASQTHKDALADPAFTDTLMTRAFTGRPARSLRNQFAQRHDANAPVGYPAVHHLTRGLRQAAAGAGNPQHLHLWAGTGYRNAVTGPARNTVEKLVSRL
jgi:nitronate monooxygenase